MAWFGFRTRSRDRDRAADRERMAQILDVLDEQIVGIEGERTGLRDRYRRAADDAAFSQEALENGEVSLSPRVDALTESMSRYTERIGFLEMQAAFLRRVHGDFVTFMAEQRLDEPGGRGRMGEKHPRDDE